MSSSLTFRRLKSSKKNVIKPSVQFMRLIILACFLYLSMLSYNPIYRRGKKGNVSYDLPYLLNISGLVNNSQVVSLELIGLISENYPNSFANFYYKFPRQCPGIPLRNDFQNALETYGIENGLFEADEAKISSNRGTLTVQLSRSDSSNEDYDQKFFRVRSIAARYSTIYIISDTERSFIQFKNMLGSLNKTVKAFISGGSIYEEDLRLYLLYKSKNIIVGGSSDGALAALISSSENGVYLSSGMELYLNRNDFRHAINIQDDRTNPTLSLIGKVVPNCCRFSTFGRGDSAKVFCRNAKNYANDPCWILSLGCNNQWGFEEEIFQRTNCMIQVFDCTGDFKVPKHIQSRVKLHKLCVGIKRNQKSNYRSWSELMDIGTDGSHLPRGVAPMIVKMDVEGWEYPVLTAMAENIYSKSLLPKQLEFELHVRTHIDVGYPWEKITENRFKVGDDAVKALLSNLTNMGYGLVHRADNPYCKHCSEVTFLHRSAFPAFENHGPTNSFNMINT